MNDEVVQELWDEHRAWSATAIRLKASRTRWRYITLLLSIGGAALATLAASLSEGTVRYVVSGTGAVALALVVVLTRNLLDPEGTRRWLRARSVSEGIKSEIYTFLGGAEPYDGANALELLNKKTESISGWAKDLDVEKAATGKVTAPAPPRLDEAKYLETRVRQQIENYYRPKAQDNALLAKRFQTISTVLAALIAALSVFTTAQNGGLGVLLGPWVAVLTTIGASVVAYAAAGRYDFQATTFVATARQLEDLARAWRSSGKTAPSPEWSQFVRACEAVISAENRGWMAKLDDQK